MTTTINRNPNIHILFATFPAFGHIIPLLELAKKVSKFYRVTFAVSASKLPDFAKRELLQPTDDVQLYGIADQVVDDLEDVITDGALGKAFADVLPAFAHFLRSMPTRQEPKSMVAAFTTPVDVMIADYFLSAEFRVCAERGVPFYSFDSGAVGQVQYLLAINQDTPVLPPDQLEVFDRTPKAGEPMAAVMADLKDLWISMKPTLALTKGFIINTVRSLEREDLIEVVKDPQTVGWTIHCVGPLFPEQKSPSSSVQLVMQKRVTNWLNGQTSDSVVYVSFGSLTTPTPEQVTVIGQALLSLGRPFIWSLREKYHSFLPEEISTLISRQFDERASPFLVLTWAPQKSILKHDATAVFLSHCGWNSTLEAMASGKPIVGWPMFGDQLEVAQLAVKLGVGVLVQGTGMVGSRLVPAEEICGLIQRSMDSEKAVGVVGKSDFTGRAKAVACEISEAWTPSGESSTDFQDLIHRLGSF
ncbi:putative cis-zeatin O-glucosyltransferase [Hypsibius exemplaris]|uniref:UDP-glucuronosyltransferase n=1 Tax=Hypsibius exemplaris TaxID=2072580 RepID=A0A1W0WIV5_HYPEX|nr:putative cis-zeatin O-glucosyltransferase [Hypsibius exemplaris]